VVHLPQAEEVPPYRAEAEGRPYPAVVVVHLHPVAEAASAHRPYLCFWTQPALVALREAALQTDRSPSLRPGVSARGPSAVQTLQSRVQNREL
jgi:hypothetical protein